LPRATAYYGSELFLNASVKNLYMLTINGMSVSLPVQSGFSWFGRLSITRYLHPGMNVVTFNAAGYVDSCTGISTILTLRMTGLQRPYPLILSWHPVKNAARYDVQVWLVTPNEGVTPDDEANIAAQTRGTHYTLNDAAMPSGTYQWRTAAVNARGELISRWTPAQTVTLS
jgi:hypothetical protein